MTENQVRDELYPRTNLDIASMNDGALIEMALRKALVYKRTLGMAERALLVISEGKDLPAAYAKNTLEDMAAMSVPAPRLLPEAEREKAIDKFKMPHRGLRADTWDHAGPDY